jgi:hypothetical protein
MSKVNDILEDPSLLDVLDGYWYKRIKGVHTCFPGSIVSYDDSTDLAVVTPLLKVKFRGESPVQLANLQDVPVVFPRTTSGGWFPKITPGDIVLVVCAERSIEDWLSGSGNAVYPSAARTHDMSDAYAIPGGYPEKKPWQGSRNSGVNELLVKPGEKLRVGNGTVDLIDLFDQLLTKLQGSVDSAGTASTGTLSMILADLAQIQAKLGQLKA